MRKRGHSFWNLRSLSDGPFDLIVKAFCSTKLALPQVSPQFAMCSICMDPSAPTRRYEPVRLVPPLLTRNLGLAGLCAASHSPCPSSSAQALLPITVGFSPSLERPTAGPAFQGPPSRAARLRAVAGFQVRDSRHEKKCSWKTISASRDMKHWIHSHCIAQSTPINN